MAILRPSSDLITGGWTSTDASLSAAIDETTASDTDYIATSTAGDIARVSLGTYADAAPSIVLKRDVWTSQPQVPVGIDFSSSLGRKVTSASYPVTANVRAGSRYIESSSDAGLSLKYDAKYGKTQSVAAQVTYFNNPDSKAYNTAVTALYLIGNITGTSGWHGIVDNGRYSYCNVQRSAETDYLYIFQRGENYGATTTTATRSMLSGGLHVLCITFDGTNSKVYIDGVLTDTLATATPSGFAASGYRFGRSWDNNAATNVDFGLRIIFGGSVLSAAEVSSLSANPWKIFLKQPKPIFISSPRGTHTLKYRAASPEADRGLIARVLELGQPPALILKRDIWTQQPQTAVEIDNSGIGNTVTAALNPGIHKTRECRTGTFATKLGDGPKSIVKNGLVGMFNGAAYWLLDDKWCKGSDNYCISLMFTYVSAGTIYQRILDISNGGNALSGGWDFELGTGGNYINFIVWNGNSANVLRATPNLVPEQLYNLIVTRIGTVTTAYVNGQYYNSITSSSTASLMTTLRLFTNDIYGSNVLSGYVVHGVSFHNKCSVNLSKQLSANPWQIFRKQPKPIFIDAPKVIASQTTTAGTIATSPQDYTLTLSAGEVASITNGAELALEIEST